MLVSKMDAKSFQNTSKSQTKNVMKFAQKRNRKNDPSRGPGGGPTNQLFSLKIQSWTPWAPQEAPNRLQNMPWAIFDRVWNRFHDVLVACASCFLWLSSLFRINLSVFCDLQYKHLIAKILDTSRNRIKHQCKITPKWLQKSERKSDVITKSSKE